MTAAPDLVARGDALVARVRSALVTAGREDAIEVFEPAQQLEPLTRKVSNALRRSSDPTAATDLTRVLVALVELRGDLREHAVARRFGALPRVQASLARLRQITNVADLLHAAAEELARCGDFDRTVISRRRGSIWQAATMWFHPTVDAQISAETRAYLTRQWIPLRPGTLESDLVHRRTAAVIRATDARIDRDLVAATYTSGYVASPVMPSGQVIGFLHADCSLGRRVLTNIDRDNLWTFAEGFGLIFEHLARVERLQAQRARVHATFAAAEEELAALSSAEVLLVRRELESLGLAHADAAGTTPPDMVLSAREREVVELMVTGAGNSEIAGRLFLSEATVKAHATRIYRKLGAADRADAVARYLRMMRDAG